MDRLKMRIDGQGTINYKKLKELLPTVFTEMTKTDENGNNVVETVIDIEKLKQEISCDIVSGTEERYQFTWPQKRESMIQAYSDTNCTLRPCKEKSVNFDSTENLYIEGNNLDVLKLLQETYLDSIKLIYIDPPYNTGNDFVYDDSFDESIEDYKMNSYQVDEYGNRLVQNTESNGRFHTDWLNMMYVRLKMARNLLKEDGSIFISIDDNEVCNLRKMCDEVFGQQNFVSQITVVVKPEGRRYGAFAKTHDYLLVYAKNIQSLSLNEIEVEGSEYKYEDKNGGFNLKGLRNRNVQAFNSKNRPNLRYPFYVDIDHPDENGLFPVSPIEQEGFIEVNASTVDGLESVWRWGKEKALKQKEDLVAYKGNDGTIRVFQKERKLTQTPKTVWQGKEIISNKGTKEVQELLGKGIFDFPKPLALIKQIVEIGSNPGDLVLDFFSGSATTAHAVMKINEEDEGGRKFIMVQLPEPTSIDSVQYKEGYKTICDIGRERIRRAGQNISQNVDCGFRALYCDSSNMKDIYYNPAEVQQTSIFGMADNIKEDRTAEDLLFQIMLELGVLLSSKIEIDNIAGKEVFVVEEGFLMACFDNDVTEDVVKAIAQKKPYYAVFRDSSMASDSVATNFDQIFASISPDTVRKVL